MAKIRRVYGIGQPFEDVFPIPVIRAAAPATSDTGFNLGQVWIRTDTNQVYVLTNVISGSATWAVAAPGSSDVDTLTGDSGGALVPTAGDMVLAGGTNITSVGAGSTITYNLDPAIILATSVSAPLYTTAAAIDFDMTVVSGQDMVIKMGDAIGAQKISFTDSADAEVASLDSDGALSLIMGDIAVTRSDSAAEVLSQVTNSDNTSAASDAFFEAAVGGTSSGNPGIRFQISGGQNYAMGIDNADSDKLVICADNDLGTDVLVKMDETTKDFEVTQGDLIIGAVAKQLQMNGGAVTDFIGQGTLVAGTVTIANTNIAAGDRILVTRSALNASPALGDFITTISAATSFTVASYDAVGSLETTDVSSFDYFIVREN